MEIEKDLKKIGLSEKQTAVYLKLVSYGEMRINEITNQTGISRSTVYKSLNGLLNHNLVECILYENHTTYKSLPLSNLRHYLTDEIIKLKQLDENIKHAEQSITALSNNKARGKVHIKYFSGQSGARQLFWNSLKAGSVVYVYSSFSRSAYVGKKFYESFVEESKKNKVKEQVITNPAKEVLAMIKRDDDSSLARTNTDDIRTISKQKYEIYGETFIYDDTYSQVYFGDDEITGFEITSKGYAESQKSLFKTLWELSKPFEA